MNQQPEKITALYCRLSQDDALDGEAFSAVAAKLDEPELLALHKSYAKQAARRFPTVPQLGTAPAKKREDETVFLV